MAESRLLAAFGWMIGAMLSFTLMAVAGRELSGHLDTFEIMINRSFIGVILVLSVGYFARTLSEVNTSRIRLQFFRNLSHFIGQNLWFFAVAAIPLSQLFAFEFTTPLWVALLVPLVLAERMTPTRLFAAVIGFFGILLIARPDTTTLSPAIIAAALCAVGFAGTVLATKLLSRTESITCILFWLVVLQAIFGVITAGYDGDIHIPNVSEAGWATIVGFCGLIAHFCITKVLTLPPATVVSPLEFLRLPLISVVGFWLYQEPLQALVFVGAFIVLAANLLNIYSEQKRGKLAVNTT